MIECKICNREFKNTIGWKHLRTHDLTTTEYKEQYGEVVSEEYRELKRLQSSGDNNGMFGRSHSDASKQQMSGSSVGKIAWNKNTAMKQEQKDKLSTKALARNAEWKKNGNHPNLGSKRSDETKQKIKEKRADQTITHESAMKAIETKKERGYDLAFFRGSSHTEESIEKIKASSGATAKLKSEKANDRIMETLCSQNLMLLNSVDEALFKLKCNTCGHKFHITKQYTRGVKLKTHLCDICYPKPAIRISKGEAELADWLRDKDITVVQTSRSIIKPYEIDIFLPEYNLGIEYCGLYWHSEVAGKDNTYHLMKRTLAAAKGIHLITLFEDEWINNSDIVKSRITNHIGTTDDKVYARKCLIEEIDSSTANKFLNDNHIQGSGRSNVRYGLFHDGELLSVMTFSKSNISRKVDKWEINRLCSKLNTAVIGGASKLFKHFVTNIDPIEIISYADKRWSNDDAFYDKLGFIKQKDTPPSYWYITANDLTRYHRFGLRKTKEDNQNITEWENRQLQGWNRIWDCGNLKYIWKKGQ
jgi:hypothetical protein